MIVKPRSMWQKIGRLLTVIVVNTACISVIVLTIIVTRLNGTGFDGYDQVSTIRIISGPTAGTVTKTEVYQPGKTLWDMLQLLGVLAIPIVVSLGAAWYSARHNHEYEIAQLQRENEQIAAEQRAKTEREIALDNQREVLLQTYLDKMSELLLAENLRQSGPDNEVRNIARVRTIVVLPGLDGRRKGNVLQFLYEAGLIIKGATIISLSGADLEGADLSEVDFFGANLSQTDLSGANLSGANLSQTDLREVNLSGAYLTGTTLRNADLSGTILRDADLSGASLSQAILLRANLLRADLTGADLSGANLSEADLIGADLSRADLEGANLSGANITEEQLNEAMILKGATKPNGSKQP